LGGHSSGQTATGKAGATVRDEPGGVEGGESPIKFISFHFCCAESRLWMGTECPIQRNIFHFNQLYFITVCSSPNTVALALFGNKWPKCCPPNGSATMQKCLLLKNAIKNINDGR